MKEKKGNTDPNEPLVEAGDAQHPEPEAMAPGIEVEKEEHGKLDPAAEARKELLYLKADFENYKRRMLRDQDTAIKFANEKFVGELLTVVDALERALSSGQPLTAKAKGTAVESELGSFIKGVEMTHRELVQLLGRFGVEFIGTEGEPFDPNRHEAIMEQETDGKAPGTVLQIVQKGCLLNGRLLKPAKVVVAK